MKIRQSKSSAILALVVATILSGVLPSVGLAKNLSGEWVEDVETTDDQPINLEIQQQGSQLTFRLPSNNIYNGRIQGKRVSVSRVGRNNSQYKMEGTVKGNGDALELIWIFPNGSRRTHIFTRIGGRPAPKPQEILSPEILFVKKSNNCDLPASNCSEDDFANLEKVIQYYHTFYVMVRFPEEPQEDVALVYLEWGEDNKETLQIFKKFANNRSVLLSEPLIPEPTD